MSTSLPTIFSQLHANCINLRRFVFFFRVKEKMNPFTLRFLEHDSEFQVNQDFIVQITNQRDGQTGRSQDFSKRRGGGGHTVPK